MNYLVNFNQTWWGNMLGEWGFIFIQIKGLAPLGPVRSKIRKMLIKIFSWTTDRNALILGMEQPWGKVILFNWNPWGHKWPCPTGTLFYIGLYSKNIKKSSSHEQLAKNCVNCWARPTRYVNYKITHIVKRHYSLWRQVSV